MPTGRIRITGNGEFQSSFRVNGPIINIDLLVGNTGGFDCDSLVDESAGFDLLAGKGDGKTADTRYTIGDDEATGIPLQFASGRLTADVSDHTTGEGSIVVRWRESS